MKLRVLDLFSGIGGFSLGLERAKCEDGPYNGFETVAFCEIEAFPRKVLGKHWPNVPCYPDVRELTAERLAADGIIRIDVITGGFPCQDISLNGSLAGITDGTRSGLWGECARLVSELRPNFAIFENVANLLAGPSEQPGGWFSRILADLAAIGYDAEWENIPAASVGAPHRRERVWLIAYPREIRRGALHLHHQNRCSAPNPAWLSFFMAPRRVSPTALRDCLGEPAVFDCDDGLPYRLAKLGACGNAVVPQIPELIGNAILQSMKETFA